MFNSGTEIPEISRRQQNGLDECDFFFFFKSVLGALGVLRECGTDLLPAAGYLGQVTGLFCRAVPGTARVSGSERAVR